MTAKKKFPIRPAHPERNCWGCERYCPAGSLACGNGSERTQHPVETFGEDWMSWGLDSPQGESETHSLQGESETHSLQGESETSKTNGPGIAA